LQRLRRGQDALDFAAARYGYTPADVIGAVTAGAQGNLVGYVNHLAGRERHLQKRFGNGPPPTQRSRPCGQPQPQPPPLRVEKPPAQAVPAAADGEPSAADEPSAAELAARVDELRRERDLCTSAQLRRERRFERDLSRPVRC